MLDAEARTLLDLMDEATKAGRPKLESLPHAVGRHGGRQDVGGQRGRPAAGRRRRSTASSPDRAARSATGAIGRLAPLGRRDAGTLPTLDLLSRRRLRDRHHRDARFDVPAAGQQEPLPGDLDRLSPVARASLPRADRRRHRGVPATSATMPSRWARTQPASRSAATRRAARWRRRRVPGDARRQGSGALLFRC